MATPAEEAANVRLALRVAVTASLCLVIGEWLDIGQTALSVYTAHLAMVLFPYSAFQKTLERLGGRVLGVLFALLLVTFLDDARVLLLLLMLVGDVAFFYVYASGRLSYGALMGGLFIPVVVGIGVANPAAAQSYALSLVGQLVLATVCIVTVNWVTGAERSLAIETKGENLVPLRLDWLNKAAMASVGVLVAMLSAVWLDLPVLPTLVSATIYLVTAADHAAMGQKGLLRVLGAVLGGGYALVSMLLLAYLPFFPVLLALVFYGMFLAAYFTKATTTYSYGFMQAGLAMPMVLIGSSGEVGHLSTAVDRLIGIAVGLAVAEMTLFVWPRARPAAVA